LETLVFSAPTNRQGAPLSLTPPSARAATKSAARAPRLLAALVALYLLGLIGVAALLHIWADRFWLATVILFGPRWLWVLPLAVLIPATLFFKRRWLLAPLGAAALVVLGPIMGFELPSPRTITSSAGKHDLRVMTYNVGGGRAEPIALARLLEQIGPDIAVFQECAKLFEDPAFFESKGWHVDVHWSGCLLSRYPIRKVDARDPTDVWEMNGAGLIIRYEIEAPGRVVDIENVHLETVRDGLEEVMHRAWRGAPAMRANIEQRAFESKLARDWTERADGPLIVMGDFNMPIESAIYQRFWSRFTNAFSEAGFGFGTSKVTRWFGIRIDHVLLGPGWETQRAWVGPHLGLDHRPMIAEIHWKG